MRSRFKIRMVVKAMGLLLAGGCVLPVIAQAQSACLDRPQAVADAGLRYAARLRVIGLVCNDQAGFKEYQLFIANNESRYESYTDAMTAYLGGSGNEAADRFDAYETGLQNAESLLLATSGAQAYCNSNKGLLDVAELESPPQLDRAIATFAATTPGTLKTCR